MSSSGFFIPETMSATQRMMGTEILFLAKSDIYAFKFSYPSTVVSSRYSFAFSRDVANRVPNVKFLLVELVQVNTKSPTPANVFVEFANDPNETNMFVISFSASVM